MRTKTRVSADLYRIEHCRRHATRTKKQLLKCNQMRVRRRPGLFSDHSSSVSWRSDHFSHFMVACFAACFILSPYRHYPFDYRSSLFSSTSLMNVACNIYMHERRNLLILFHDNPTQIKTQNKFSLII